MEKEENEKSEISMEEKLVVIRDAAGKFASLCDKFGKAYALFYEEEPHCISGGATFSVTEVAILLDVLTRRLTMKELLFLQKTIDTIIEERNNNPLLYN